MVGIRCNRGIRIKSLNAIENIFRMKGPKSNHQSNPNSQPKLNSLTLVTYLPDSACKNLCCFPNFFPEYG